MLATEGFTGSDLAAACRDAAMAPVRELLACQPTWLTSGQADFRPLVSADFMDAVRRTCPSCAALSTG